MSRRKKKSSYEKKLLLFIYFLITVVLLLTGFLGGYFYGLSEEKSLSKSDRETLEFLKELQKKHEKYQKPIPPIKHTPKESSIPSKENIDSSEIHDYGYDQKEINHIDEKSLKKEIHSNKPKLIIIIDDVAFYSQVKMIKQIPFTVTPSFFPPSKNHPNTPKYAKEFKDYMVHLPMQATNPRIKEESHTLHTHDSYEIIKQKMATNLKAFPSVKFINNHTGSLFTSNDNGMNLFFRALSDYNIAFVDSKTTAKSRAKKYATMYHKSFFVRDIFLDNKLNKNYIQTQLKKAVSIAKKRGYAIAIGHPHKTTLKTLSQSTHLLKNIEVITINELEKLVKNNTLSRL